MLSAGVAVRRLDFLLLAGANFAVALGYGAILPILPMILSGFGDVGTPESVAWHTGGMLGAYMLALFVAAPFWGAVSDRIGGRQLFLLGLTGYAVAVAAFVRGSLRACRWRHCWVFSRVRG